MNVIQHLKTLTKSYFWYEIQIISFLIFDTKLYLYALWETFLDLPSKCIEIIVFLSHRYRQLHLTFLNPFNNWYVTLSINRSGIMCYTFSNGIKGFALNKEKIYIYEQRLVVLTWGCSLQHFKVIVLVKLIFGSVWAHCMGTDSFAPFRWKVNP